MIASGQDFSPGWGLFLVSFFLKGMGGRGNEKNEQRAGMENGFLKGGSRGVG